MFVRRFHSSAAVLLVLAHIIMGVLSLGMMLVVWPERMPENLMFVWPMTGGVIFYLVGQTGLFLALRRADASRVSPMLGLKLVILPIVTVLFLHHTYGAQQWLAVALCVVAAVGLNNSGEKLPTQSLGWILFACLGYSLSDLNITALIVHFKYLGITRAVLFSASMSYVLSGIAGGIALPFITRPTKSMWINATPFALTWFTAMLLLFACFGTIGTIFGNIVQATRGLISIAVGVVLARAGMHHLERNVERNVLLRRLAAALLMTGAIVLFSLA